MPMLIGSAVLIVVVVRLLPETTGQAFMKYRGNTFRLCITLIATMNRVFELS